MRKCTGRTVFNGFACFFTYNKLWTTRTVLSRVERTIAEETVQFLYVFMTGIIFAFFIGKKLMRIIHDGLLCLLILESMLGIIP